MIKRVCGNCWYWNPNKPETAICKKCGETANNTSRKYFFPREMVCQVCDEPMVGHCKEKFFNCEYCGTETHPFFKNTNDQKAIRQEFEKQLPCERSKDVSKGMIHVKSRVNGGSKSKSSGNKKQLLQKPSTTAKYKELASSPNKIKYVK
jgi:hypothetical protein